MSDEKKCHFCDIKLEITNLSFIFPTGTKVLVCGLCFDDISKKNKSIQLQIIEKLISRIEQLENKDKLNNAIIQSLQYLSNNQPSHELAQRVAKLEFKLL